VRNTPVQVCPTGIGVSTGSSIGTSVSANASAGTYGSWTQLTSSIDYDAYGLLVTMHTLNASMHTIQIGVGAAASETSIGEVAAVGSTQGFNGATQLVPIFIPAGTRISARSQSLAGGNACYVSAELIRGGSMNPLVSRGRIYGLTSGDFTQVDPGGTANTLGSWVELASSTTQDAKGYTLILGNKNSNASTTSLIDLGLGAASSEVVILSQLFSRNYSYGPIYPAATGPIWTPIPAGSRLAARAQCASNVPTGNTRYSYASIILWE